MFPLTTAVGTGQNVQARDKHGSFEWCGRRDLNPQKKQSENWVRCKILGQTRLSRSRPQQCQAECTLAN